MPERICPIPAVVVEASACTTAAVLLWSFSQMNAFDFCVTFSASPAFGPGDPIPPRYTCDGENVSPELRWDGVPDGTIIVALACLDPDAPAGAFTHWLLWDVDPLRCAAATGQG